MTGGQHPAAEASGPVFELQRVFDAPRELVFNVWTDAGHLARWWGPAGSTIHVERLDLRPGGMFLYRLTLPEGYEMWGKFVYREIAPPERLVYISSFADAGGNTIRAPFSETFPLELHNTLTLTEHEGKTALALRTAPVEPTAAEREMFESFFDSMEQGFAGTMEQLTDYLDRVQVGNL